MIGIVDQGVAGVVRSSRDLRRSAGALSEQPRGARDHGVDRQKFRSERIVFGRGQGVFERVCLLFLLPGVVAILAPEHVESAGETGAGRGIFDAAARLQHRMRPRQFMGWGVEIHLGIVQDEVFRMDEVASKPQRGAGVGKVRAGEKTVADGAGAQPFVEAGEGVLGFGDREEEFGPIQRRGGGLGCFANH